jgi:hypothetical protein
LYAGAYLSQFPRCEVNALLLYLGAVSLAVSVLAQFRELACHLLHLLSEFG